MCLSMTHIARYAPQLSGWPKGPALRIAALSDFHACRPFTDEAVLGRICSEVAALSPDLVLLLGDYASGPRFSRDLTTDEWARALSALSAPLGVHAVLGNHDYDGMSREAVLGRPTPAQVALEAVGIPVYVNRAQRLEHGGQGFWLAGLGDQFAFNVRGSKDYGRNRGIDDLDATLAQVTTDEPVILMAHEPDLFPETPDRVGLTLSGHTHAGQIRLFGRTPVVPSRHGSRYVHGHFADGARHLIVSAGLGYSGWPIRFGTRTEIVLVELGDSA